MLYNWYVHVFADDCVVIHHCPRGTSGTRFTMDITHLLATIARGRKNPLGFIISVLIYDGVSGTYGAYRSTSACEH